jgi:hypothetical protein
MSAQSECGQPGDVGPCGHCLCGCFRPLTHAAGKELGRGRFGVTRMGVHRKLRTNHAIKSILKAKMEAYDGLFDVRREVAALRLLAGHPGVVQVRGGPFQGCNLVRVMAQALKLVRGAASRCGGLAAASGR